MGEFRMPSLGADMTHGTLVRWLVEPGTEVRRGDIVALVHTHKGTIEIEVFENGTVEELLVEPDTVVPVGTVLARIRPAPGATSETPAPGATGETPAPAHAPAGAPTMPVAEPPSAPAPASAAQPPAPAPPVAASPARALARAAPPRRRVSPLARRTAEALHVDLRTVQGTGAEGAVTRADVQRAAQHAPPAAAAPRTAAAAPAPPTAVAPPPADGMRQAIAAAVTRSKREIPHYYIATQVDMSRAIGWIDRQNATREPRRRLLPAALVLRAIALALREQPALNGFYVDGAFRPGDGIHIGMVVSLRSGGIVVPAIRDADALGVDQVMDALRDVVQRARAGGLRASELSAPTITVTNLGDRGADIVYGVIYPPQVALVGVGRIREQPWAERGMLAVRPVVSLTLAADHRVSDGHGGSLFLAAVDNWLQHPERL